MIKYPLNISFEENKYEVEIWKGQFIGNEIAADCESDLAPFHTRDHKLAVFQAYAGGNTIYLVRPEHIKLFLNIHAKSKLIWQNAPFDIQVLMTFGIPKETLLKYYDANLIYDTKILWQLYNLAVIGQVPSRGESSLKHICLKQLGIQIDKNNDVRTSFGQYIGKPYEAMDVDHAGYAALDVVHTYNAYCSLLAAIAPHDKMNTLLTHHIQVKGDLVLDQCYKNGLGVNLELKDKIKNGFEKQLVNLYERLATWGWVRGKKGIKITFENIVTRLGVADKLPKTEKGSISSSYNDLKKYSYMPFIKDYIETTDIEKQLSFVSNLQDSVVYPTYTSLLNTGRTSAQNGHNGINPQILPKNGDIRDIFIPKKKDKVFIDVDYSAIELSGLSQVLLSTIGESKMASIINEGKDLHIATAALIYRKPEEEITKSERQFAKIANFGLPANMAPATFVDYCNGYGVSVNEDEATSIKNAWLDAYPEMAKYYSSPNGNDDGYSMYGKSTYSHCTLTGRVRANCTYTAYLNTHFQGLCADGLKLALYNLYKAGYSITTEIHDAIIVEVDRDKAEEVKANIEQIMIDSMKIVIPDVRVSVEGRICETLGK